MSDLLARLHKEFFWLILNRPPLNPLNVAMLAELQAGLQDALQRRPRLVVITGSGERAFCAGVDLPDDSDVQRAELLDQAREATSAIESLHAQGIPTVALVKGSAFGAGCELVALCDTVIAREDALFRLPASNARVFPAAISTYLPASIGPESTKQLMQSGETLTAQAARRLGLVHQVLSARRFSIDSQELLVMLATIPMNG